MRCGACGKESEDGIFCSHCGEVLSQTIRAKPLPEPTAQPKAPFVLPEPSRNPSQSLRVHLPSGGLVFFCLLLIGMVGGIALGIALNRPKERPLSVNGTWSMCAIQDPRADELRMQYQFREDNTGFLTLGTADPIALTYQFDENSRLLTLQYQSEPYLDRTDIWFIERSGKELIFYTWYPEDQAHGTEYCRFEKISQKGTASTQAVTGD